jgi:hypothetical protein
MRKILPLLAMRKPSINQALSLRGNTLLAGRITQVKDASPKRIAPRAFAQRMILGEISVRTVADFEDLPSTITFTGELFEFQVPAYAHAHSLPEGYGFKGGLARHALRLALEPSSVATIPAPRDVDLVRRFGASARHDDELLKRLNPDDYERGAKIEEVREIKRYLDSRDLTVNEVITFGDVGVASPLCVLDTIGAVLRATRYRGGSMSRPPGLSALTVAKCLRLAAEEEILGGCSDWIVIGVPNGQSVTSFAMAVQLRKAFERGEATARRYLELCAAEGISFNTQSSPQEQTVSTLIEELLGDLPEGESFFTAVELDVLSKLRI